MRLWLLDEVKIAEKDLVSLIRVLVERADNEKDYLLPGYTHLQVCDANNILEYLLNLHYR